MTHEPGCTHFQPALSLQLGHKVAVAYYSFLGAKAGLYEK